MPTSANAVTQGDGVLQTLAGGTIMVYYNDANDGDGQRPSPPPRRRPMVSFKSPRQPAANRQPGLRL